jgi:hypothetical protein
MNALSPRARTSIRTLPVHVQHLVIMGVMVALLALLAVSAVLNTAPDAQAGYVNGSFGAEQRADYGTSLDRRIAPQRSAPRG